MIRFGTVVVPFRWKYCNDFSLKVISQSHLSLQKQFLSRHLVFAKFSDDKAELLKQLQDMVEINTNIKTTEKEIENTNHDRSAITPRMSEIEKSSLLRCIEACDIASDKNPDNEELDRNVTEKNNKKVNHPDEIIEFLRKLEMNETEEEKNLHKNNSQYNNHHDNFHEKPIANSDFLKELKSCDVSSLNDKLENEINSLNGINVRLAKNLRKPVLKSQKNLENFDESLDSTSIQNALKVVVDKELQLCPYTTVWFVSLISSNLSHWNGIQNAAFMASEEFIKFLKILLIIIPNLSTNDVLFQIHPFCKKLPECFSDILNYKIFKIFEDEVHKMKEGNAGRMIDILRFLESERHNEALNDLINLIDEKLISLYKKDRENFFTLPVRHNLSWTLRGHTDDEFRSKVLLFLAVLPNYSWIQHNISRKYAKILYTMDSSELEIITNLEDRYFKKIESLSNNLGSLNEMVDFIYCHGKAVQRGQTKFRRNLVHIVLNNIIEQNNLSFNSLCKLVSGLQKLDHYNYKFGRYLAEFFISELQSFERDILSYNKVLTVLVNYDSSSLLKEDWPHFKFLLKNSFFVSNKSYWYNSKHNWMDLLDLAITLSYMKIFPDELLQFLSQNINNKKILNSSAKCLIKILQLNRAIHFSPLKLDFVSKEMLVLIKEKVNQINMEDPGIGFNRSMSVLEEIKKSVEKKIQLNDCVLIDCYTDLGQRIPLLMAFDRENNLHSLQKLKETKNNLLIRGLQLQENIKLVAVLFFLSNAFISSAQGVFYLKASHLQNVQCLEVAGCHVEYFKYCDILNLPSHERGSYIYEIVKNKLNTLGHDR